MNSQRSKALFGVQHSKSGGIAENPEATRVAKRKAGAFASVGRDTVERVGATPAVEIRKAVGADEPGVRACVDAAYAPYVKRMGKPPAPMLDDYANLINSGVVYVATLDDLLVGLIVLWPKEDHLYIDNVAVLPEAQGAGVGGALLDFADAQAQQARLGEIRLYTNEKMTENIQYYPRKGYHETHRASDAGYKRVYYSRFLDPQQT